MVAPMKNHPYANMAEADDFLEEVESVSRLIDGLQNDKVSVDYVDKVMKEKDEDKQEAVKKVEKKKEEVEKSKYENLPDDKKKEMREKVCATD